MGLRLCCQCRVEISETQGKIHRIAPESIDRDLGERYKLLDDSGSLYARNSILHYIHITLYNGLPTIPDRLGADAGRKAAGLQLVRGTRSLSHAIRNTLCWGQAAIRQEGLHHIVKY